MRVLLCVPVLAVNTLYLSLVFDISTLGKFTFQLSVLIFLYKFHFQQFKDLEFDFILLSYLYVVMSGYLVIFGYCYFGQMATNSFMEMSDCAYRLKWYVLPLKLQKNVGLMIAGLQKPVYYHGVGIAIMELNMFVRVCIFGIQLENKSLLIS